MNYNVTIHTLMPFNPQYPRPTTSASKKEDSNEKKISFQDVLKEKMMQK
ncbi:hypothetical protein [Paenibacillus jiagnxiensis]